MIPKIIHFFWIGDNPIPEKDQNFIDGWRKTNPDYEIKMWNETNYDFTKNEYMRAAYENKKFGFVPDYARLDVIYNYGGFYFDTDVEIIKSLDGLLNNQCFFGFESEKMVNLGHGFGAEPKCDIIKQMLDSYSSISFVNSDGTINKTPSPVYQTDVLKRNGLLLNNTNQVLNKNIFIYSSDYFAPMDYNTAKIELTDNTVSIHHYHASWFSENQKKSYDVMKRINNRFGSKLGKVVYQPFRVYYLVKEYGVKKLVSKFTNKIRKND